MMEEPARAVLHRLERRDTAERQTGVARSVRLRQVTPDVGRFLHTLVLASRPSSILEIGTSGGYSTVWIGAAARTVGASVTTLEIDPVKVELASASIRDALLQEVVSIVPGDAFAYLRQHAGPIDFVFLDAEKEDYLSYYDLVVPLLSAGGVLVADNLVSHASDLAPFRERALSDPGMSAVVLPVGRGELFAVKIESAERV